jgi:Na+-driven multidrug efflux pump
MPGRAKEGGLAAFIVIGSGVAVVGMATKVWGLVFAGLTFIIIGVASIVGARKLQSDKEDQRDDQGHHTG